MLSKDKMSHAILLNDGGKVNKTYAIFETKFQWTRYISPAIIFNFYHSIIAWHMCVSIGLYKPSTYKNVERKYQNPNTIIRA